MASSSVVLQLAWKTRPRSLQLARVTSVFWAKVRPSRSRRPISCSMRGGSSGVVCSTSAGASRGPGERLCIWLCRCSVAKKEAHGTAWFPFALLPPVDRQFATGSLPQVRRPAARPDLPDVA